jgi:hypothetical protein
MSFKISALRVFQALTRRGLLKWVSDEKYARYVYKHKFGRKLNLDNPQTFNEKIQWLKLYDRRPEYTIMADKYRVRQFIADKIGEEYLIPLLGVWDNANDIDFEKLPKQFVLKCNHDQGSVIICKNKDEFDIKKARRMLNKYLRRNHYWGTREWPYKDIIPCIIAEKYMVDESGYELKDYKLFCFNGKVKLFKIDFDRFNKHRANYYDVDSKQHLPFGEVACPPDYDRILIMPEELEQMINLAKKLSIGYEFLRVDFYNADSRIYFSELTFFPASGIGRFTSKEWDYTLGSWLKLPHEII